MTTLEAIEERLDKLRRRHTPEEQLLRASLFGPNRMGGRRSKGVHEMPTAGTVTGVFIPDWLRARADRYFARVGSTTSVRAMVLIGLYELTKDDGDPDEDAQAAAAIREHPDAKKYGWDET